MHQLRHNLIVLLGDINSDNVPIAKKSYRNSSRASSLKPWEKCFETPIFTALSKLKHRSHDTKRFRLFAWNLHDRLAMDSHKTAMKATTILGRLC